MITKENLEEEKTNTEWIINNSNAGPIYKNSNSGDIHYKSNRELSKEEKEKFEEIKSFISFLLNKKGK